MANAALQLADDIRPARALPQKALRRGPALGKLADLAKLGALDIETPLVADLSADLHSLFDAVTEDALPIYFGPLLGRLYLEGL